MCCVFPTFDGPKEHLPGNFSASLLEQRTRVLFSVFAECDTTKERISAEEKISSEDLRMRISNEHSLKGDYKKQP